MRSFPRAVESADSDAVLGTLAEHVTFHNAVMFRPIQGLDAVRVIAPHLL